MGIDTVQSEQIQTALQNVAAFNSAKQDLFRWSRVLRSPEQLRMHPVLVRLKLMDSAIELNQAIPLQGRSAERRQLARTHDDDIPRR